MLWHQKQSRKHLNYNSCGGYLTDDEFKKHTYLHSVWNSINDISYIRMLLSFKPLKPKYWLTREQQDFFNLYIDSKQL